MDNFFNSKRILDILIKWKIQLAIVVVAAVVLSVFFSSPIVITPLYKSDAVIYPSNISPYSDENETEQSVQIFQSRDIRDSLVKKFDLARHWGIDSNYRFFKSTLLWIYSQRVKVSKTPYEAVQIEVWDPDPQTACNLVNALMEFYNKKIRSLHKEKFEEVVDNYNYIIARKKNYLDSLKNKATELGTKYGLLDFQAQTREVTRAYLSTGGGSVRSAEAKAMKKNMEEKGSEMLLLSEMIRAESYMFSTMKLDADRAMLDYNRNYTYVNVLSKPFPADKKSYPVRWLIVVVSTLGAFFLALLIIGVIENRKYRQLSVVTNEG
ncbi:MAG: Wzz/FepE/Etk N-terminal domain-containing protein [bacterium]